VKLTLLSTEPMDFMPDTFPFQVMSTVLVCAGVNRNVHDPRNKHGRFDREDRKILKEFRHI
jgi:hypothetical protein